MNRGEIVQEGSPREIYLQPHSEFVAQFIGSTNQFSGKLRAFAGEGCACVETPMGELLCTLSGELAPGSDVVIMVRPENIILHEVRPPETANVVEGKVATGTFRWVAYHTLFFTDLYLTRDEQSFQRRD